MGLDLTESDPPPAELTITADGYFWSRFGPTVVAGQLDTDLLLTRTTVPLRVPAQTFFGLLQSAVCWNAIEGTARSGLPTRPSLTRPQTGSGRPTISARDLLNDRSRRSASSSTSLPPA